MHRAINVLDVYTAAGATCRRGCTALHLACARAGSKQISAITFIAHPFVRKDIGMYASKATDIADMALGATQESPTDWGDAEGVDGVEPEVPPKQIAERLAIIFSWIEELFAALDLESRSVIDLSRSGASIYKILSDMNLAQLWETMSKAVDHDSTLTDDQFMTVALSWMGIDETFEMAHQRTGVRGAHLCLPMLPPSAKSSRWTLLLSWPVPTLDWQHCGGTSRPRHSTCRCMQMLQRTAAKITL